jgi:hypothetical protein
LSIVNIALRTKQRTGKCSYDPGAIYACKSKHE